MNRPPPSTAAMDAALLAHARGGPAVYKAPLYVHAEREACARANGCATWAEWDAKKTAATDAWWQAFMDSK